MTSYIVLKRANAMLDREQGNYDDTAVWLIIGHVDAHGPDHARRQLSDAEGEYLVVPVRNASFLSSSVEQPPPKVTTVEVHASTYLDVQQELATDDDDESADALADEELGVIESAEVEEEVSA